MVGPVRNLYLHIPFCPQKCSYCAFVTHIGSTRLVEPYVEALTLDLRREAAKHAGGPLETVYFGGGTPSMLSPYQIETLLSAVASLFGLTSDCEITLEAHPGTVSKASLTAMRSAGVNRISFGAESMNRGELKQVGRSHGPAAVRAAVVAARQSGIPRVALDLIYGLPGSRARSWQATLTSALSLPIDHLSLYPLSIEPGTVMARRRKSGTLDLPLDDDVREMYDIACQLLRAAGFRHYEVSNWSLPGAECRHNLAYWRNRQYYAVGVGAHGYLGDFRSERMRGVKRYIERIARGLDPVVEYSPIDAAARRQETVMLGLRLLHEGLDLDDAGTDLGMDLRVHHARPIDDLVTRGWLQLEGSRLRLPETHVPVANEIWSQFM